MSLVLNPDIYRAVLECLPIGVYLVDRNRQIAFWNASAERITGYLGQEVVGRFCHDNLLMHCDQNEAVLCGLACPLAQTMQDGCLREASVFLRHKDGQRIPVRVEAIPLRDEFGAIIGSAEFFEERRSRFADNRPHRVFAPAAFDDATELPGCEATEAGLEATMEEFNVSAKPFGVLCIAIDHLDQLRSFDGHQAVRAILHAAAQTMVRSSRPADLVGRWQADRFVAVLSCSVTAGLLNYAERVKRLVSLAGVPWWGDRLTFTVSMGGTMAGPGDTVESLIERAGRALEACQAQQENSILVV